MSAPREHVEAVALVVDPAAFRHVSQAWEAQRGVAILAAEAILTSTDPAVHTALLAALVRAGVLMDEVAPGHILVGAEGGDEEWRRYVTEWEAAP